MPRMPRHFNLERLMGVEPTYAAWEAAVLPMNYSRRNSRIITDHFGFCNTKNGGGMKFENAINKSNKGKSLVTLIFLSQSEVKKP